MASTTRHISFLDQRSKTQKAFISIGILLAFVVVYGVAAFGGFYAYRQESKRSQTSAVFYNLTINEDYRVIGSNNNTLMITATVDDIDAIKKTARVSIRVLRTDFSNPQLNGTMLLGDLKAIPLTPGMSFINHEVTLQFKSGDVNSYPFDSYKGNSDIYVGTKNPMVEINAHATFNEYYDIPFGVLAYSEVQNWRFKMDFGWSKNRQSHTLAIEIRRAPTTIAFSIFVMVLVWLITIGASCITFQTIVRNREVVSHSMLSCRYHL